MAIEDADIMIVLKDKEEWTTTQDRETLVEMMKEKLEVVAGASFEFTQPIQLRFNELMTGAKTDIAIKIFGENTETLKTLADQAAQLVENIPGAGDVKVDQTEGLPQLIVQYNRTKIAQYGLNIEDLNTLVRTAFAGESAGVVFENERKFDLVLRLEKSAREQLNLDQLFIHLPNGTSIPMSEVASVDYQEGPMQVSRENARRRINIGVNVRNRDIASLVAEIEGTLDGQLNLPPGYAIQYGGQFENLQKAQRRLAIAVPVALLLIFALLYFTFEKIKYALIIFTAVPFSAIGGVMALWLRGMPFSISAGVGFIALFGVAVLNGIVLISYFNQLRYEHGLTNMLEVVVKGGLTRLRPVIMTAAVAALGFLPMALSTTNGAEVQRPLATVVIGGLITATLLTLIMLPILYYLVNKKLNRPNVAAAAVIALLFMAPALQAQQPLTLDAALENALSQHPVLKNAALKIDQSKLGVDAARQLPPTQFNFDFGQINSDLIDYHFSASQSLGNPAVNKQRKAVAEASIALSESELALQRHEVTTAVKQAYYQWIYRSERLRQLEDQAVLQKKFLEKTNLQFEFGEVGRLEKTLAETQHLQALRAIESAQRDLQAASRDLQKTAFLTGEFSPPGNGLPILEMPAAAAGQALFTAPIRQEMAVAQQQAVLQKKQLAPEFSLGYFNQSIRPDYSFQGVSAGVAIPFYKKHQRALAEQWDLEAIMAANQLEGRSTILEKERATAKLQASSLRNELDSYGRQLTDQATLLRQLAQVQLDNGEIDFFRYWQSLQMALNNELDFLDLQYQYVEAVLQVEYLNQ
ncbi:MAG: efflux RND transporter permease subunit [Saprospiraceae bacterium]